MGRSAFLVGLAVILFHPRADAAGPVDSLRTRVLHACRTCAAQRRAALPGTLVVEVDARGAVSVTARRAGKRVDRAFDRCMNAALGTYRASGLEGPTRLELPVTEDGQLEAAPLRLPCGSP